MLPFQPKPTARPTFEDVFFEHRARLYEWALQLTDRNHAEAEDLVQELYIRIARVGPVPEHIENAENYLFSTLRNLFHRLAQRIRSGAMDELSIVDYESAEHTLRAMDRHKVFFIREDLHRVCDYLCERKNTSRSASIFMLRYFLGYYPNEVVQAVKSTRGAVDLAIHTARAEARLDLDRPGVLQSIAGRDKKPGNPQEADDSHGLFLALRGKIFQSCCGECFPQDVLRIKYEQPREGFSTGELAHLVSCPRCLDAVNRILGLPLLDERSPDETIGRDTPRGPSGSAPTVVSRRPKRKAQDPQRMRRRMLRRLDEVNQHRPKHILIAVDGEIRASQRVTAQLSEQLAELRPTEKPGFIEVLSEQNFCLAFVMVQAFAPENGLEQTRELALSDGRTMSVSISFASASATVQVVYSDPVMTSNASREASVAEEWSAQPSSTETPATLFSSWSKGVDAKPRGLWDHIRRAFSPDMNPLLASAMLFSVCAIVCFALWTRSGPQISAGTLLTRAEQTDVAVGQSARSQVVYQKVRITTSGHVTERAIYRDPQKKRRLKQQPLTSGEQQAKDKLNLAGVNWDEPLSVADYRNWHDRLPSKQDVVTRKGDNLLTLTTSTESNGAITKESLTVRESDFHAVDRTIELRNMGTVEIAELNYDVMPWGAVNQDWFEPLAGGMASDAPGILPTLAVHAPRLLSNLELNEAEVQVRYALHKAGADLGEPIDVQIESQSASGVFVTGIVSSAQRKQDLLAVLSGIPHVAVHLRTEDAVAESALRGLNASARRSEPAIVPHHSPIEKELFAHFAESSAVQNFSARNTRAASDLLAHAWALRHLSDRYGAAGATNEVALNPTTRQLLEMLRHDHLKAMADETSELSASLRPVLEPLVTTTSGPMAEQSLFANAEEVHRLTLQLLSGASMRNAHEISDPSEAAGMLLAFLNQLQTTLEKQP